MRAPFDPATKLCRGPAHPQPIQLPLDEAHWGFYRTGERAGKAYGQCKLCRHWNALKTKAGPHGLVPAVQFATLAKELIDRCGSGEKVYVYHGIQGATILSLAERRQPTVRLRTVQHLLQALDQQRREDRRNGASPRFLAARKAQALQEERLMRLAGY